jgi:hypothetical protein
MTSAVGVWCRAQSKIISDVDEMVRLVVQELIG